MEFKTIYELRNSRNRMITIVESKIIRTIFRHLFMQNSADLDSQTMFDCLTGQH